MSLHLITAPSVLPLTLDEVRDHLRQDEDVTDQDALIMGYLRAAVGSIDGRDGYLGRALCTQTWEMRLDRFSWGGTYCDEIRIPLPPLQRVISIAYIDGEGNSQTLDEDAYTVLPGGFDAGKIVPAYGTNWPVARCQREAVTIQFVAGYLDNNSPADTRNGVPAAIKSGLLIDTQIMFDQPTNADALMTARDALYAPYRILNI